MNRLVALLVGPEAVMLAITLAAHAYCARHATGEGRDLRTMGVLVWALPPLAVVAAYLTVLVPGAANHGWLARAALASLVGVALLAHRIVAGFGEGAKGQEAGYVIALMFGGAAISLGTAICGAYVRAQQHPTFAEWFRARPLLGSTLTVLAALPIGVVLFLSVSLVGGFAFGLWSAVRR